VGHSGVRETGIFFSQWQQRIAFAAAEASARLLEQEEDHEGENKTEADGQREGYNGHGES
jgi:hypothetical protein